MTRRTPPSLRRLAWLLLIGVLAVAGWFAGRALRGDPPPPPASASPPTTSWARTPRPDLPSLVPAAAAEVAADQLHPRPADEWQGMLVDLSQRQYCEASAYCGFALACLEDRACGPCQRDDQCGQGEACVLDHCVAAANVGCRSRTDCGAAGEGALCVLSGLTGGEPRGNSAMRSYCQAAVGGVAQDDAVVDERRAARLAAAAAETPVAPPVSEADLRAKLDAALP